MPANDSANRVKSQRTILFFLFFLVILEFFYYICGRINKIFTAMARLVNLSWIKISSVANVFPPAPMRGIVKRTSLLLLMAIFGSNVGLFAQPTVTHNANSSTVSNLPLYPAGTNVTLNGTGTADNPYQIGSPEEWDAFATIVNMNGGINNAWGVLTKDITFTKNHQQPGENPGFSFTHDRSHPYTGTFDGQGHTITLSYSSVGGSGDNKPTWGGLFWHVKDAIIMNLKVTGVIRTKFEHCGTILQHSSYTNKLLNCDANVQIINESTGANSNFGGLIGSNNESVDNVIQNCYAHSEYASTSENNVTNSGGLWGILKSVTVKNSYAAPQSINSSFTSFYTLGTLGEDGSVEASDTYYKMPSYNGTLTSQGETVGTKTASQIAEALNEHAKDENNQACAPWVAHNGTVYLNTFAQYVDITGWVAGGSPNDPQLIGNRSSGDVTYQYQPYGGSYSSTVPTTAGRYTVKVTVPAGADANGHTWNAWESTMEFCIVSAPTATSYTYNGTAQNLVTAGTAAVGTFYYRLGETGSWSTTIPTQTTPGDYTVYYYVKGDETHNDIGSEEAPAGSVACSISKIEVGLSWNIPATNPVYDGQTHCITANATGMINDDVIGVTVTGEQTNAGEHTATASELTGTNNGYYKLPAANTQTFIISTRPITVTPDEGQSKTYGEADPTLTYTVDDIVSGESLSGSLSRADGSDVGNYAITQGGVTDANNSNYNITFTSGKTFAITQKTVGITWGPTILTYNNTAQAPTAAATGLVGGDVCNVTVTGQQTAVGVYSGANVATANALDNGNYQLPDPKPTTAFEIANPLSMSFAAGQLWGTWYGAYNYQVPTGMTAYKVSSVSGTTVTVDAIGYVPANTGVLINRTATDAADVSSNIYNGVTAGNTSLLVSGNPTAYTDYILFNDQFVLSSVSTIGDHRCYLPGSGVVAGTRGLNIVVGGDDTTDIEQKVIDTIETGEWYDMPGRRIVRPHKKGIYIRDGKKVVIK